MNDPLQFSLFTEDNPERELVEYKSTTGGRLPKDLWESVTAFANADGGKIMFGVDAAGRGTGLNPIEIDKLQRDIQSSLTGAYSYYPQPEISANRVTVSVYIPPAPAAIRPVYYQKLGPIAGARVRVGSVNEKLNDEWVRRFSVAAKGGAELMVVQADAAETLDKDAVLDYIARLNRTRGGVYTNYSYEELLKKLNITKDGGVTLFGLLAFSKDATLQEMVAPTITVSVTQYAGTTKTTIDGSKAYRDQREFFGPVANQFHKALQYILEKVPIQGIIDKKTGLRTDDYLIPELAIREALANTIAHRDYSVQSSKIQIDMYSDRIEFINPGISLIPISELEKTSSITRNPLLMNFLRERGITEHLATGIRRIKLELRKAGLREPSFKNTSATFVATIHSTAFITAEEKAWLEQFSGFRLNERQNACLIALRSAPDGINNSEYRDLNGLNQMGDDKKANKELRKMVDKGILIKSGSYILTRYYLDSRFSQ